MSNKYRAIKTYSALCGRKFDSKWEATRAEQLFLLQKAGEISGLEYQVRFKLCEKPRITVSIDFKYQENGEIIYEDAKGVLTRDARTKYAWLEQSQGIKVRLARR